MKYRRKPAMVEAFQFSADAEVTAPDWFGRKVRNEQITIDTCINDGAMRVYGCTIQTPAGRIKAKNGEYVVMDESGMISVYAAKEFRKMYERAGA